MSDLEFRVIVKDDGSAVVERFGDTTTREMKRAAAAATAGSTRISRAFRGVRAAAGRVGGAFRGLFRAATSLKGLLITGLGALGLVRAFQAVVQAANIQEDAVKRLNDALRTAGQFSEETSRNVQALAAALETQTRFGDEAILSMQALLVTYGVTADQLEETTKLALDYAAATGKDLRIAAETLGKATTGIVGELANLGVVIDKNLSPTEAFADLLRQLRERVGGRAQRDVQTFAGAIARAANAFGTLKEQIGFSITGSEDFREAVADLTRGLIALSGEGKKLEEIKIGDVLADAIPSARTLISAFFGIQKAVTRVQLVWADLSTALEQGISVMLVGLKTAEAGVLALEVAVAEVRTTVSRLVITELAGLIAKLTDLITFTAKVAKLVPGFQGMGKGLETAAAASRELAESFQGAAKDTSEVDAATRRMTKAISDAEAAERTRLELWREREEEAGKLEERLASLEVAEENATRRLLEREQKERESARLTADEQVNQANRVADAMKKASETTAAAEKFTFEQRLSAAGAFFSTLRALAETGGQQSFALVKAFAVGEAIVSGILAVQKALASAPPPFNFALAAAVAAMAAINVARIAAARPGGGPGAVGAPAGAGPPAPAAPPPAALPAPVAEAVGAPAGMQVNISVAGFVGNEQTLASELGRVFREAARDGVDMGLQVSR